MIFKKLMTKRFLIGLVLGAMLSAVIVSGCTGGTEPGEGPESGSESGGGEGSESGGEGGESGGEGPEGSEGGSGGSEEGSGATLAPDATFDAVRGGARLILNYDAPSSSFKGTVENTTNGVLTNARIEVHLSDGTELGPTTPIDLAPGEVVTITLLSTQASFTGWVAHAEVGSQGSESGGGEGSESGGEGGESGSGESGSEGGSEAAMEAAMSSPIIPLGQSWNGVLGGLAVSAQYDGASKAVHGTVRNTTSQKLCYVQSEPHLKSGTKTVGELGPEKLGDLNPGQEATTSLAVASEPKLAGVSFDGYVIHMEVFDCSGPGPVPHTGGEGAEGSGGEGPEGTEAGSGGSEEGSGATLALDETFDAVRSGARLILNYDAPSNSFKGTVENTTNGVLTNVRIEVHLSNGTELGPTTPIDIAPGEVVMITLPSTQASFTGWIAHAEVGSQGSESGGGEGSESGSESGGEGAESGSGESGSEGGSEAANEAAMSSPVTPLGQTWNGVLGGLAVSARYDAATRTVHSTVRNTTQQKLCYVQAEPHLKSGTKTVGELGPDKLGDLNPGQEATTSLAVSSEPKLAGVSYDGYVIHMEVFDCAGPGPVAHSGGEGAEGGGGEGHGPGGEGSGSESGGESGGGSEEGSGATLALDEIFDAVRGGARLILKYDAPSNSFKGIVENTTNGVLTRVRIEVHLSNGTELGPTTPINMAPGEMLAVFLPATQASFTRWVAHAEVGGSGSEGSSSGGESGGEHSSGSGGESGGEHSSGGESGGEHGSGGERRGGG